MERTLHRSTLQRAGNEIYLPERKGLLRRSTLVEVLLRSSTKRISGNVIDTVRRIYGMENCHEITLEANPDDLCPEYLQMLSELPFNRISMGIQTFDDTTLKLLKRQATMQAQAIRAVELCRAHGFRNISIDLIYGLPGETTERWEKDLQQAIALDVEHISAYHLIYEEGTPIYKMLQKASGRRGGRGQQCPVLHLINRPVA